MYIRICVRSKKAIEFSSITCEPFWSVAAPRIFSGDVLLVLFALTQIIQMRSTRIMMKTTEPAMPPAMYANVDFSSQ